MMLPLEKVGVDDTPKFGGKAVALSRLARRGYRVPPTLCLSCDAYRRFVEYGALSAVIVRELGRKPFEDMRWEELWDAALRIRNRFLRTELPDELRRGLEETVGDVLGESLLVVRSSAPGEDSGAASFAGLHESVVGVPLAQLTAAVRQVWASLWSDRALLYRKELGLDVTSSAMGVVVQELVEGNTSGVAFSKDPTNEGRMVIEAVHGLNQGLVDGAIEPDRWFISRRTHEVLSHKAPRERWRMVRRATGLEVAPAAGKGSPLSERDLELVNTVLVQAERDFGGPQDMEWTIRNGQVVVLQVRPVTAGDGGGDSRAWYLSLTRTLGNLHDLRVKVEQELLPEMDAQAETLAAMELEALDDRALAAEIDRRRAIDQHWVDVYWREFIPLAHGVRLFGQFYNDVVKPVDPFQFMDLLAATPLLSIERNQFLEDLAAMVRTQPELVSEGAKDQIFEAKLEEFNQRFGGAAIENQRVLADRDHLLKLIAALAAQPAATIVERPSEGRFLDAVDERQRATAIDLLELARASYRLRDDDNIHLAAIKTEVLRAVAEERRRLGPATDDVTVEEIVRSMQHPNTVVEPKPPAEPPAAVPGFTIRTRQLVGQPAGPGVAVGRARIVDDPEELFAFQSGEVIVCDSIEPNMTFIVPLAAAVVERRGGMLIHGAIIAREYGLPCVTGVPQATTQIRTGDRVTVDGFLGIVTLK